jgi:hypothetical protein
MTSDNKITAATILMEMWHTMDGNPDEKESQTSISSRSNSAIKVEEGGKA